MKKLKNGKLNVSDFLITGAESTGLCVSEDKSDVKTNGINKLSNSINNNQYQQIFKISKIFCIPQLHPLCTSIFTTTQAEYAMQAHPRVMRELEDFKANIAFLFWLIFLLQKACDSSTIACSGYQLSEEYDDEDEKCRRLREILQFSNYSANLFWASLLCSTSRLNQTHEFEMDQIAVTNI
uniref:Uncharacterized protein n=1 Tax=Onchocerca volvulus TaxID=6282 RepID=A0A8R1XN32_ONCVO